MQKTAWEEMATAVATRFAGGSVTSISRFSRGLHHYVFDVTSEEGRAFVVCLGEPQNEKYFEAAMSWHSRPAPLGTPLRRILAGGRHGLHPFFVLERIPGKDLEDVYDAPTTDQKREIAAAIVTIQTRVRRLPEGAGYGDALAYEGHRSVGSPGARPG